MKISVKICVLIALCICIALPAVAADQSNTPDLNWYAGQGYDLDIAYVGEYFNKLSGGTNSDDIDEYVSLLNIGLTIDTEKAELWQDGSFGINFKAYQGRGINPGYIGAIQNTSNVAAFNTQEITHLFYHHKFEDGKFWFRVGKQNSDAYFGNPTHKDLFIHSSAHFSPTIPNIAYPRTNWGGIVGLQATDTLELKAAIFRAESSLGDNEDGLIHFGEAALDLPLVSDQAGQLRFGLWHTTASRPSLLSASLVEDATGWYLIWDQRINERVAFFTQYGHAPEETFIAENYFGGGVVFSKLFAGRQDDTLGFGFYNLLISDDAATLNGAETALEVYYDIKIADRVSLRPDVQYILNPSGADVDAAFIAGARVVITM